MKFSIVAFTGWLSLNAPNVVSGEKTREGMNMQRRVSVDVPEAHLLKPEKDYAFIKGEDNYFFETNQPETFMIDDKDFKVKTFTVAGREYDDTWGFANATKHLPQNHHGYSEEILAQCGEELSKGTNTSDTFIMPLAQYSKYGTANYYPNTNDFVNFKGIDLIPENENNYVRGSGYAKNLIFGKRDTILNGDEITIQRCKKARLDGKEGGLVVDRVGPFYSTGGYDWWQMGWTDVGGFSEILEKHPEGFDVEYKSMQPVAEDGRRLGNPPIHIHHVHVIPTMGVRPRNFLDSFCLSGKSLLGTSTQMKNCYNSSLFMEQHGDYQCEVEDDGIECMTTTENRRFDQVLDIEGELNDVRPAGSETIKWYYQAAYKWRPIDLEIKAVSQSTIMAPAELNRTSQLSRAATFNTPTHDEHMIWYTGRFEKDGELYRNKLHAHNLVFESSQFFLGEPRDFGLLQDRMTPEKSYVPLQTTDLGFKNNDDFLNWIFSNLEESQRKYDQNCVEREDPSDEACGRPRPRLVCIARYSAEDLTFGGEKYDFDRRPKTNCEPLKFREGDAFTVTGFSRHLTKAPQPHKPNYIPAFIPGHVSWTLFWHVDGWLHSRFSRLVCTQRGIFFDSQIHPGMLRAIATKYTAVKHMGAPIDHTEIEYHLKIVQIVFYGVVALMGFSAYKAYKKSKEMFRYKKLS